MKLRVLFCAIALVCLGHAQGVGGGINNGGGGSSLSGGTDTYCTYWTGVTTVGSDAGCTFNATTNNMVLTGTITATSFIGSGSSPYVGFEADSTDTPTGTNRNLTKTAGYGLCDRDSNNNCFYIGTWPLNAQTGTSYTLLDDDAAKLTTAANAAAVALALPQASSTNTSGFYNGHRFFLLNTGRGLVTTTPTTSLLGGRSTQSLATGHGAMAVSDGTDYQMLEFSPPKSIAENVAMVRDEFMGGANTSTTIGELQWIMTTIANAPTGAAQNGVANHPGIMRITTAGASGDGATVNLSGNGSAEAEPPLDANTNWEKTYVFQLGSCANIRLYVGMTDTYNAAIPANFIGVRLDTNVGVGDSEFTFATRKASASGAHGTTYACSATTWYQVKIWSTVVGTIWFQLNGNAAICLNSGGTGGCTADANIPIVALTPVFSIATDTTATKYIEMDYFASRWTNLARY
jgi:hypothetical protein